MLFIRYNHIKGNTMAFLGKFIVVDGMDGSGKGTQLERLSAALGEHVDLIRTREPGGSPLAEHIRGMLLQGDVNKMDSMTELLLMYASRRANLRDTVIPALERGAWILSDRFADSSFVYQGHAGELGMDIVEKLHSLVVGDLKPDLTIILDVPAEVGLKRTFGRGGSEDRMEQKGMEFHRKVREGFHLLAERSSHYAIVNADQSVDDVTSDIFSVVQQKLGIAISWNVGNSISP